VVDSGCNIYEVLADLGRLKGTATSEDLFLRVSFWFFGIGLEKLKSVVTYRGISAAFSAKSSVAGRICAKVMNATCKQSNVFSLQSPRDMFLLKVCIADERICGHCDFNSELLSVDTAI
jgi:hypothetical protein